MGYLSYISVPFPFWLFRKIDLSALGKRLSVRERAFSGAHFKCKEWACQELRTITNLYLVLPQVQGAFL